MCCTLEAGQSIKGQSVLCSLFRKQQLKRYSEMKQLLLFGAIVTLMAALTTANLRAERERREEFEEIPLQGSGNDKDFFHPHNPDELVYHFTDEEIERYRRISIDRNGTETTATDNEVIAILEKVRKRNSSSSFSQPHFPVKKTLRHNGKEEKSHWD